MSATKHILQVFLKGLTSLASTCLFAPSSRPEEPSQVQGTPHNKPEWNGSAPGWVGRGEFKNSLRHCKS